MTSIHIPRPLVNQLLHHAQAAADQEICGLISAKDGRPLHCYPIDNVAAQPAARYAMDPQQQIAALRRMRDNNEELFAIYHSHPTAPAAPSPIDIHDAAYPEALYLIISLNTQGVLEMRGFRIHEQHVHEIALEL